MKKDRKPLRLSFGARSLAFTPFGTRYILITLGVGLAAVNSGSNLLYLAVAMMLSLVIVSGILSEQSLNNIHISRKAPEEIYAGTPFAVRFTLKNGRRRVTSYALAVSEYYPGGGGGPAAFVTRLAPGEKENGEALCEVPRRGRWVASGAEVATRYPFGLFRKARRTAGEDVRTVYPHVRPLGRDLLKEITGSIGETPSRRRGAGAEVYSLREYRGFDEARLIHWKSSARLSTLMAKEFEAEEKKTVAVVFDNLAPDNPDPDFPARFEEGVSLAASLIRYLMFEKETPVSFVCRDRAVAAGSGRDHYLALMEILATVKAVPDEGPEDALLEAQAMGPAVLVPVDRGFGWARRPAGFSLILEARP